MRQTGKEAKVECNEGFIGRRAHVGLIQAEYNEGFVGRRADVGQVQVE